MKKALIVLLETKKSLYDTNYMIDELTNLCETDDIFVADVITQRLDKPTPDFYVGSGKVLEIKDRAHSLECDMVVFDDELTPSQIRNLGNEIGLEIYDRSYVILDIFSSRAKTHEAKLEIELARCRYLLPRLGVLQQGLSRQGSSGSGLHNRGKGETKLELDKRILMGKISRALAELDTIKRMKDEQAKRRVKNEIPIVALVGYTNAGKSTTMNKIISYTEASEDKMVYEKDELFATLSTSTRHISYKKHDFLLVDTVGFVSKLPHHLVNSFKSTLEEIKNADLIIHVVDISSRYFQEQYSVTTNVLNNLGCSNIKTLLLLNKYDKYDDMDHILVGAENLPYSNYTNLNVDKLLDYIYDNTIPYMLNLKLNIPYKEGKIFNILEENAVIHSKVYFDEYVFYDVTIDQKYYHLLQGFDQDSNIN